MTGRRFEVKGPTRTSFKQWMPSSRVVLFTFLAMVAFAGNSLLCRLALRHTRIDASSFTSVRLFSGAAALWLITRGGGLHQNGAAGNWTSAAALFAYAAAFSFAYVSLSAGTGALLLFGAVQATMILYGLWAGERLSMQQGVGLTFAFAGLIGLLLPGLSAPPPRGAVLMLGAGIAWGAYSLRGRSTHDPVEATAGNFLRAAPLAAGLSFVSLPWARLDGAGIG